MIDYNAIIHTNILKHYNAPFYCSLKNFTVFLTRHKFKSNSFYKRNNK